MNSEDVVHVPFRTRSKRQLCATKPPFFKDKAKAWKASEVVVSAALIEPNEIKLSRA